MLLLVRSIEAILAVLLVGLGLASWYQYRRLGERRPPLWRARRLFLASWLLVLGMAVETRVGFLGVLNILLYFVGMVFPLPAGILAGWWRGSPGVRRVLSPLIDGLLLGSLVGVLVMEATQMILVAVGNYPEWLTWSWSEIAQGLMINAMIGLVQGLIGALIGNALAHDRQQRQRGDPDAPAGAA